MGCLVIIDCKNMWLGRVCGWGWEWGRLLKGLVEWVGVSGVGQIGWEKNAAKKHKKVESGIFFGSSSSKSTSPTTPLISSLANPFTRPRRIHYRPHIISTITISLFSLVATVAKL